MLRKLSLSCCFFFSILKTGILFWAVLDSVSRSVGELFSVSHKCKQHFVEKTQKVRWVLSSFPSKKKEKKKTQVGSMIV